jgi:Protein of unknown function (DUF3822)
MSVIQQNNNDKMRIPTHIVQKADQCHLAMHWTDEGIMVGIFDITTKQPLWLEYQHIHPWELMQAIQDWKWNQPLFRKVTASHCSQQWTLCPVHLFDENQLHIWFTPHANWLTQYQSIQGQNIMLIEQFANAGISLQELFSHAQECSIVALWMHYHLPQHPQQDHITLIVENDVIGVLVKKQGELQLANQFAGKEPEDILYFASAVLQQNELSQNTTITLVGKNASVELKEYFEPYFINVQLWTTPLGLQLPKNKEAKDWHSILLHTLCAS